MNTHRNPKPGLRALRKGRVSMPGQVYLITTTCRDRRPHFESWEAASAVSATLTEHRLWRGSRLLCWVLMPDHLHVLVQLADTESLPKLVQRVKAVTARVINAIANRRRSTVWAAGYHDRAVRAEEDLLAVARYVVANPLRAGLAERIGDYAYWDAIWLGGTTHPPS